MALQRSPASQPLASSARVAGSCSVAVSYLLALQLATWRRFVISWRNLAWRPASRNQLNLGWPAMAGVWRLARINESQRNGYFQPGWQLAKPGGSGGEMAISRGGYRKCLALCGVACSKAAESIFSRLFIGWLKSWRNAAIGCGSMKAEKQWQYRK
jgi:hypothetical protein